MITLQNKGELGLFALKTMGVNVKSDSNSIGYFGTGLKYAVAVFLRENIPFKVFVGEREYRFGTESVEFRGKDFELCKLYDDFGNYDLGFTTELGKNWDVWQAYREIHSNCLDESGEITKGVVKPREGYTTFQIDLDIDADAIFLNTAKRRLLYVNKDIEIYQGESDCIFYRGIKAKVLKDKSLYTYNVLKHSTLTEDRLLCYDWELYQVVNDAILQIEDKKILKKVVTNQGNFEATTGITYRHSVEPSETFKTVCRKNFDSLNWDFKSMIEEINDKENPKNKDVFFESLKALCLTHSKHWEQVDDDTVVIKLNE